MTEGDIAQFHKGGALLWPVMILWASWIIVPALVTFWGFFYKSKTCTVLGVAWLTFNLWVMR